MKKRFSEEQEAAICARYEAGESAISLAKELGGSPQTICNLLARRGVARRTELSERRLTLEQRDAVASMLGSGATRDQAAATFGVSKSTVHHIIKEHDMKLRIGTPPTCQVNHAAFDTLTPEALYWMGFLFSDGCIHKEKSGQARLIVGLAEKDRKHLEKFRAFCGSTHAITRTEKTRTSWGGPCVYVAVRSQSICDRLTALGMVKKCSRVPTDALVSSSNFWRGAIDGDGWIGTTTMSDGNIYPYIGLCGQPAIMEAFNSFLKKCCIKTLVDRPTESGIRQMTTTGETALTIIETLYHDPVEVLARKYERASAIIDGDIRMFPRYDDGPSAVSITDAEIAEIDIKPDIAA